jgi:hypothetical protein
MTGFDAHAADRPWVRYGEAAPIPAVRGTAMEPPELTRSGHPPVSLDDLVGVGEDGWRDRQPQRLGRLEIDHQLKPGRLLDRQVGGLGTIAWKISRRA